MRLRATVPLMDDSDETWMVDNRRLPVVPAVPVGSNLLSLSSSKVVELGDASATIEDGMIA
eukprot:CAMPEP_0201608286 /NCGR_PEP_ID=MMETSP0492-20130828/7112_1 /ASSEMBLY_ACC=CAM_ASM_000837 /TAXON_ID=420259 /ORGANISM="Thalassiosira gravida, Strain GMp14c1" /LENGTH=60 /DNA_ID=CAMNT_0048073031 /DNA_START=40 /DNA_END=222 /DNA_ORIENTATION=+